MDNNFGRMEIQHLYHAYRRFLIDENSAMRQLVNAREDYERGKARAIADAYAKGLINGKNAEERANQVAFGLQGVVELQELEAYLEKAEREYQSIEIDRKTIEAEISLTKAWLYSQSGVGK